MLKNIDSSVDPALDSIPDDELSKAFIISNKVDLRRFFITEYNEAATMDKFKREGTRKWYLMPGACTKRDLSQN